MGVHKSTISREFSKNMTFVRTKLGSWQYKPDYAQTYVEQRHKEKPKPVKFTQIVKDFVREKLLEDWSPEQISGYAKKQGLFSMSHERIYQFILSDKEKGGELYKHLRHQHKKYRKRYGSPKHQGPIKHRRFIDDRPAIVDEKKRIGDWEVDTIIGKNHKQAILSMVERVSKYTLLKKLAIKTSEATKVAMTQALGNLADRVHTITSDNGAEFAKHKEISIKLNTDFFFAHPYSSWERGLNENTNGLVRQYLKKGAEFINVTDESLAIIAAKLNSRPRKTLDYVTPNDVFGQQRC